MQLERCDRHGKTEVSQLAAENSSLRQRLDRADADLLHSRRENLRLCDQISNLEKEVNFAKILLTPNDRFCSDIIRLRLETLTEIIDLKT